METMFNDPYLRKDCFILNNKFGIESAEELSRKEFAIVTVSLLKLDFSF